MRFQSVGSQYDFGDAWAHLFARGSATTSSRLQSALGQRYGGTALLYANGRSALTAALKACVTPANSVAINGFTCYVVQEAVKTTGARPAFLDIDISTLHFSRLHLEKTLKKDPNLKVVVVQNTFGIPCNIAEIEAFAKEHGLILIEDLAHCVGLTYPDGRKAGTIGDFTMLSFGRDKLLDCVSGGALVIRNPLYVDKVQPPVHEPARGTQHRDRWYPMLMWWARTLFPVGLGKVLMSIYRATNLVVRTADGSIDPLCAMPPWQASRVLSKLTILDEDLTRRHELATTYASALPTTFHVSGAPVRFPFLAKNRKLVLDTLKRRRYFLEDTWYDTPIGPKRLYEQVGFPEAECPTVVEVSHSIINLPTHRHISKADAKKIAHIVQGVERESV